MGPKKQDFCSKINCIQMKFGCDAIWRRLKNGLKTQKRFFLPVLDLHKMDKWGYPISPIIGNNFVSCFDMGEVSI